jgi:hypothetical protein
VQKITDFYGFCKEGALLRVRLTNKISRALPRMAAAMAQAQPTLPAPMIPSFMAASAHDVLCVAADHPQKIQ